MAKIKGTCKNIDEECGHALSKTVQEIERSSSFVCEECGKPLLEVKGDSGGGGKKPLLVIIAAVIFIGVSVTAYFLIPFVKVDEPLKIESITLDQASLEMRVNETATLKITITPPDAKYENIEWSSEDNKIATVEDGVVTAISKGDVVLTIKDSKGSATASCKIKVEAGSDTDSSGGTSPPPPVSVTGGSYEGQVKAGKPHGQGTLTYKSRTRISMRDMKERYAEAGQYIIGEFHEGELVQGKLFDKNNEPIESLILGRPH